MSIPQSMWTTDETAEELTVEEDMTEVLRRVQRLKMNDTTIEDRFVQHFVCAQPVFAHLEHLSPHCTST